MTNDYNNGLWWGWNGGECPVHPETRGEFVFADGSICKIKPAGAWEWSDKELPIIAFRVITTYQAPREFWAVGSQLFDSLQGAKGFCEALDRVNPGQGHGNTSSIIKLVEVKE